MIPGPDSPPVPPLPADPAAANGSLLRTCLARFQFHNCTARCIRDGLTDCACRYGYPRPLLARPKLAFGSGGRVYFRPSRNEAALVPYNDAITLGLRAHTEIVPLPSSDAVLAYVCKASGSHSGVDGTDDVPGPHDAELGPVGPDGRRAKVEDLLLDTRFSLEPSSSATALVRAALVQSLGTRAFSVQEGHHLTLGLPMFRSPRDHVSVFLSEGATEGEGDTWTSFGPLANHSAGDQLVARLSLLDRYRGRPAAELGHLTLLQFGQQFEWRAGRFVRRQKEAIVSVRPVVHFKAGGGADIEEWAKQRVLLSQPFIGPGPLRDLVLAPSGHASWTEFASALGLVECERVAIARRAEDADAARTAFAQLTDGGDGAGDGDGADGRAGARDGLDGLGAVADPLALDRLVASLPPEAVDGGVIGAPLGRRQLDLVHEWPVVGRGRDVPAYWTSEDVRAFFRRLSEGEDAVAAEDRPDVVRLRMPEVAVRLSTDQARVLALIDQLLVWLQQPVEQRARQRLRAHAGQPDRPGWPPLPPQLMIVQGRAGSGKSLLISRIRARVAETLGSGALLVAAPTGQAALAVGGQTVHTALSIPVRSGRSAALQPLDGDKLRRFTLRYQSLGLVIIDEYSSVGLGLLRDVDTRLRQLRASSPLPFGGIAVLLVSEPLIA